SALPITSEPSPPDAPREPRMALSARLRHPTSGPAAHPRRHRIRGCSTSGLLRAPRTPITAERITTSLRTASDRDNRGAYARKPRSGRWKLKSESWRTVTATCALGLLPRDPRVVRVFGPARPTHVRQVLPSAPEGARAQAHPSG